MSCAMGFGELNIPSSRAFWDDCDEDEPVQQTTEKLQLSFEEGQSEKYENSDLLLLVEGLNISEFAEKTLLNNAIKICRIPAKNSTLYYVEKNKMFLAILEEELTCSGEITDLLLPYAEKAKNVITLTVKPKVDYKSENIALVREEITFLRGINADKTMCVKELKAPNFITGVAAGIASWCDNNKLPVSSYVAYTDKVALDTLAAQPIIKLLQLLGIGCSSSYTPKVKDDSHLYM